MQYLYSYHISWYSSLISLLAFCCKINYKCCILQNFHTQIFKLIKIAVYEISYKSLIHTRILMCIWSAKEAFLINRFLLIHLPLKASANWSCETIVSLTKEETLIHNSQLPINTCNSWALLFHIISSIIPLFALLYI